MERKLDDKVRVVERMKNRRLLYVVLMGMLLVPSCVHDVHEQSINSVTVVYTNHKGWNIPKIADMKYVSKDIRHFPGIKPEIEIEKYINERENSDEQFVLNNEIIKEKTDSEKQVRECPLKLTLFRIAGQRDILLYIYQRFSEYTSREKLLKAKDGRIIIRSGVPYAVLETYIVDMDNDGIYETEYDSYMPNMNEEECLTYILKKVLKARVELVLCSIRQIQIFLKGLVYVGSSQPSSLIKERIYNPKGWTIPDTNKMDFKEATTIRYPGIPYEIVKEEWYRKKTRNYYIKNNFLHSDGSTVDPDIYVKEWVVALDVYKTRMNKVLGYYYVRIREGLTRKSQKKVSKKYLDSIKDGQIYDGSCTFMMDLDNDGKYESMFFAPPYGDTFEQFEISLLKLKLGLE